MVLGELLSGIQTADILAAIPLVGVATVFRFVQGMPNAFPPEPPFFPVLPPSKPEILINKPHSGEFPPSPEPFPVPQPEKPEPFITRVPLLGLKEYLDNYVFSSGAFKGRAAKGFEWVHIMDNHAPWGGVAQQRLKANPDYLRNIYEGMTEKEIQGCVMRAWKNRERYSTQDNPLEETRIRVHLTLANVSKKS